MTGPGRRFDASELGPDGGPEPSTAEIAGALAAARELETLSALDQVGPTAGFEDRVMTAIAAEAPPRIVLRPASPGFGGRVVALAATFGDAWRIGTSGHRPILVRAQAMAFVLIVILATGSLAGVAFIGAANVLGPPTGPAPSLVPVVTNGPPTTPTPSPIRPSPSPTPSVSPDASPSAEPGATDDHGSETAEPTESNDTTTPKPARTPKPTETPEGSDDHGGGGGNGGEDGGGEDGGGSDGGGSGGGSSGPG